MLLCIVLPVFAADPATPPETGAFHSQGRIGISFENTNGNADEEELEISLGLDLRIRDHRLESKGRLEFDTLDGTTTSDKWGLFNRYSLQSDNRWDPALWFSFQKDRFANLNLRTFAGPVISYTYSETEALTLRLDAGPIYLHENLIGSPNEEFWGPGLYLTYEQGVLNQRARLYLHSFAYHAVDTGDKRLLHAWAGIRFPAESGLFSSLEYEIEHNSRPPDETVETETTWRIKIGYSW